MLIIFICKYLQAHYIYSMINKYNNSTTIRLDPEIKTWLLQLSQKQNRSLSNLINTILKNEKECAGVTFEINGQVLKGVLSRGDSNYSNIET
jgi:predicted DNA-binding protein